MLSGKAAIVGIGATDFSKDSGRSELRLAAEAVQDVLNDAGLTPADLDGSTTFTVDSKTEVAVARAGRHRRVEVVLQDPLRGRCGLRDRPAGRDDGGPPAWPTSWSPTGGSTSGPVCGSVRCRPG
jgi:hypothetical protein